MTGRWLPAAGWSDESERCTDIEFTDAVADPIGQVARVYDAVGFAADVRQPNRRCAAGWQSVRAKPLARRTRQEISG